MNPFQNRFLTPAEGDVVFGTNGIRRKPGYLNDQPNLGLSAVAPGAPQANPEDAEMQPMIDKGTDAAIQPGPEGDLEVLRGEPTPAEAAPAPTNLHDAIELVQQPGYIQAQLKNPRFLEALKQVSAMAQRGEGPIGQLLRRQGKAQGPAAGGGLSTFTPPGLAR